MENELSVALDSPLSMADCNSRLIDAAVDSQLSDQEPDATWDVNDFTFWGQLYLLFSRTVVTYVSFPESRRMTGRVHLLVKLGLTQTPKGTRVIITFVRPRYALPIAAVFILAVAGLIYWFPLYVAVLVLLLFGGLLAIFGVIYNSNQA